MSWKDTFKSVAETAVETVSTAAGSAMGTVTEIAKQAADDASTSFANAKEQYNSEKQLSSVSESVETINQVGGFCSNCGTKLAPGVKYCPGCGTPIGGVATPPVPSAVQSETDNPTVRKQEYAGKIVKCPNCGASIGQTMAICPECGYRITGQSAVSSVQNFSDQLMALELKRKKSGIMSQILGESVDPVDKQKLSLIRSFPIPNTIDDIQEFIMLAVANIDVSLSKNSMMNKWNSLGRTAEISASMMPKAISDAWVLKMQQAYQKALSAFPSDPAFANIKRIYVEKMGELKIRIDD